MTRPSFQFYPKDWLGNTKLRRCSAAARGVWMDVLCVLHDSDEYGIARYPLAELANAAGAPLKLLRELADKGVLKGCDKGACDGYVYLPRSGRKVGAPVTLVQPQAGPIWFSSRFVKDEHLRTVRAEGGMGEGSGAPPRPPPKASPKGGFGEGSGPRGSSSSSALGNSEERGHPARARVGPDPEPPDHPSLDGHQRTPAGEACRAIREAGIADANPGHPDLLRLLAAQVPVADLEAAARDLVGKGKGRFALLLATVEGRLRDTAAKGAVPDVQVPWHESRSGIEAKGRELGLGVWDEYAAQRGQGEQWPAYRARVYAKAGCGPDGRALQ